MVGELVDGWQVNVECPKVGGDEIDADGGGWVKSVGGWLDCGCVYGFVGVGGELCDEMRDEMDEIGWVVCVGWDK